MPRKKKTATAASTMSKSDFIRAQPADMPAKEVVARAKTAGLSISDNYVYTLRYEAKKQAGKTSGASKGAKKQASASSTKVSSSGIEDLLRAAASEIGLSRAISILQEQQNTLRAVLGK
jgi:hypothetical protein